MPDDTRLSVKETLDQVAASGRRRRIKRWGIGAVVLLMLLGAAGAVGGLGRDAADTPCFHTEPVRRGDLVVTVTATGNLEATNEVEVGSELSGTVTSMTADYNDTVTANQPLAFLDNSKYQAAVNRSRADLAAANANCREALAVRKIHEKTVLRYRKTRELTGGKLPSLEDLEQAEAQLEQSIAAVAAARAAIQSATASLQADETDLSKTVIYAPISGIVLSRDVEPGQTVAASLEAPVLFTLAEDLHHMELLVDVDEADVGLVKADQAATFCVDAYPDRTFAAAITQVRYGAETTDGVVTYKAVLRVENPDLLLRPGMTATATIAVRTIQDALLVPNTALRFTPSRPASGRQRSGGLLQALMPGPPDRPASKKTADTDAGNRTGRPLRIWLLQDNRPVSVAVDRQATDGVLTAIAATNLKPGEPVITHMLTTDG